MIVKAKLFDDFCRFAKAQIESGDIDPMYPLLRRFYANEELDREQALWRTLLYVAWYHVGSAEKVWRAVPEPRPLTAHDVRGLPTGIERRAFRGNTNAALFLNAALGRAGKLASWVDSFGEGTRGWDRAREEIRALPWCGPWASYKFADLMKHVHGLPLEASDIGVGGASETAGPIPGMVRLTGEPWKECAQNVGLQRRLLALACDAGVPFAGLDQLETALCDFNSLCKGGYYVGHDIDDNMTKLRDSGAGLWESRAVFDDRWRGEVGGWFGVRKPMKTVYSKAGRVLV